MLPKRQEGDKAINRLFFYQILIGLVVILFVLFFGVSFGVVFVSVLLLLLLITFTSHDFYKKTDNKVYQMISWILGLSLLAFLSSFVVLELYILQEVNSDDSQIQEIDYVVILGAGLQGGNLSNTLQSRMDKSLVYLEENRQVPVILSGGRGSTEEISEAEAMGNYLVQSGIPEDRLIYENDSTTTEENLTFSRDLMKVENRDNPPIILIVTSDYHMYRAKLIATKLDVEAYGIASPSPVFVKVNYMIREYFGVVKTFFFVPKINDSSLINSLEVV